MKTAAADDSQETDDDETDRDDVVQQWLVGAAGVSTPSAPVIWTRLDIGSSSKRDLYASAHWQITHAGGTGANGDVLITDEADAPSNMTLDRSASSRRVRSVLSC
jgi:hypothetical protein